MLNTGERPVLSSQHGLLTTVGWQLGERTTYASRAARSWPAPWSSGCATASASSPRASEIEALAAASTTAAASSSCPRSRRPRRPALAPDARGLITGITRGTTRAHLARAALEGIALQIADLLHAMAPTQARRCACSRSTGAPPPTTS
jgi:glycerol kinase